MELNPRPTLYKSVALPLSYTGMNLVLAVRLELTMGVNPTAYKTVAIAAMRHQH